jgi:hypothetical protein
MRGQNSCVWYVCALMVMITIILTSQPLVANSLKNTIVRTNNSGASANCSGNGCTATAVMFPSLNVVCPVSAGLTCTFYIHVESIASATSPDNGFFRFS